MLDCAAHIWLAGETHKKHNLDYLSVLRGSLFVCYKKQPGFDSRNLNFPEHPSYGVIVKYTHTHTTKLSFGVVMSESLKCGRTKNKNTIFLCRMIRNAKKCHFFMFPCKRGMCYTE